MCSSRLVVALLLVAASGAEAQTLDQARARLAQTVAAWKQARAVADSAAPPLDTVQVWPLVVVTGRGAVPAVRAAATAAADSLFRLVGNAVRLMDPVRVVVPLGGDPTRWAWTRWTQLRGSWVNTRDTALPGGLTGALLGPARIGFVSRGGAPFMRWAGTFPSRTVLTAGDLERAYLELVLKPTAVNRDCLAGDLRACGLALGVRVSEDPVADLYDAEDRRRLVDANRWPDADRDRYTACQLEDDGACRALLRSRGFGRQVTLSIPVRWTLLTLVLESGGPDAWHALIADTAAPLADRLAAGGGKSLDSLLAEWQRRVVAAGNRPALGTATTKWTAVLWVAVVIGFSLRSTRWRSA